MARTVVVSVNSHCSTYVMPASAVMAAGRVPDRPVTDSDSVLRFVRLPTEAGRLPVRPGLLSRASNLHNHTTDPGLRFSMQACSWSWLHMVVEIGRGRSKTTPQSYVSCRSPPIESGMLPTS